MQSSHKQNLKFANHDLFVLGKLDIIDDLSSQDYQVHSGDKNYKGRDFIRSWIKQQRTAVSDLEIISVEILEQTKDTVAWQRTLRGVHQENWMGIAPSGHRVMWRDMMYTHFQNDKIAEEWMLLELAGALLSKPRKLLGF